MIPVLGAYPISRPTLSKSPALTPVISTMKLLPTTLLAGLMAIALPVFAQDAKPKARPKPAKKPDVYDASIPKPTQSAVRYGKHQRHILDFWKADSDKPTPLVFVIHGGGWNGGSKERLSRFADASALLEAGISVAAINYRFVPQAVEAGIKPPVKAASLVKT